MTGQEFWSNLSFQNFFEGIAIFAESVILKKLADFKEAYGWMPVRHSIEEIEKASAYIQSLLTTNPRGEVFFEDHNWTPKLVQFVQNERAMCAMDCEYYLTRYYKIAANNRIVRFKMRSGQRVLYRVIQELEAQGRGIEIQALKARQQGITTLIEGIMSHRALFVPGAKCSIASADAQKTYVMMGMVYTAIDHIPWWLSPVKTKDKRSGSPILEFANIGTSVVIQSGTMKGGIGQGTTPTAIHLSEVCDYTDPVTQIEEGLFMAVHSGPEIFMVLESTGNGNTGWWADQWRNNKENYHKGDSRLLPLFLPWFMTPELFPPPDFREHHPVKPDWRPAEETIAMTHKCEAYANNTPILSRILGKNWKLPIEQQWFWEWKFMDARRRRTEKSWLRQMPCVTGDTLVSTERGIMPIAESAGVSRCESGNITRLIPRGKKPIWKLTTADGRFLRATKEHRVRLFSGEWREMQHLQNGDAVQLAVPIFAENIYVHKWNDTPIYQSFRVIDEDMGRLLGYFMGDGSFHAQELTIACDAKDEDVIEDVCQLIEKITGRIPRRQRVGEMVRVRSNYQYWKPFLQSIGAIYPVIHSTEKRPDGMRRKICVPECIYRSPKPVIQQFLRGLYECDGHANKKVPRVILYSAYDELLTGVQQLLLAFKIKAQFMKIKKISGGSVKGGKRHEYTGRELVIRSAWVNQFYGEIGFFGGRKHTTGKRRESEKYADATLVDEVVSIEDIGIEEEVFDLSVAETHKFGANGVEVHNCDDFEALIGDHDSVVGRDTLDLIEKTRQKHCEVYGILGEGIAERHEPPPMFIDPDAGRLYSTWKTPKEEKLDWFFMPYLDTDVEKKDFNPLKKLLIWEHPQKDCDYSIGCDTGTGVGGDRSTVCVNRTGYDAACDVQVAEFASDDISNVELYAYVAAISAYYAQFMDEGRHPKLIIEQKRKYGDTCQHQLNLMGMRRHHEFVTYDKKTLKPKAREGSRLGWFTNEWSRPMLLSTFKYAIENGWFIVNSPFLKEEVEGWEQQLTVSGKTKMDHQTGKHDDRIFAAGMAYFTMHDLDVMIERAKKKFNKPDEEGYLIDYSPFHHQAIAGGDRWSEVFGAN